MKNDKLMEFLKKGSFNIPFYLFQYRNKFELTDFDFMFLAYLSNKGSNFLFNPEEISESLNMTNIEVMTSISNLSDKHLIEMNSIKNDKNVMEEYISLDLFYRKITGYIVEDINDTEANTDSIYDIIEKEFGRTLSPMEYEIIKAWIDSGTNEELIKEALKEATYNNVTSLRYIDKVIYEWGKKGFKTVDEVRKHLKNWKDDNKENTLKKKEPAKEVFDFDWFDDDGE